MSITPFTADGAIDEGLFRAHLRFLAAASVGVYVASQGSGEGDLLSFAEKVACYRIAVDEIGGTVPVVAAGIGLATSTAAACELAAAADAQGIDAVQVLAPKPGPLPLRRDELAAYFRSVIGSVTRPVHLSNNPVLTGADVPFDLFDALLAEFAHISVVNVADPRLDALLAFVAHFAPRVEVRVGITAQARAAAGRGARGWLSFEANVAPEIGVDDDRLPALNAALARGGNPRSLKAGLAIIGRDGGHLRPPYRPLTADQYAELAWELAALGLA
jgi:4-hydroxy-tetrahydrodipicolinate synthase